MKKLEYVFIQADDKEGISKKSQQPYHIRKLHLADPKTFKNHRIDFAPGLTFDHIAEGDKVTVELKLVAPSYGDKDSYCVASSVTPVI